MSNKLIVEYSLSCLIVSGLVIALMSVPFSVNAQSKSYNLTPPCSQYKIADDWIFALLPQGNGMREYSEAVLRAMRKLNVSRPIQPSGKRQLPIQSQVCTIKGKVGIAIWNFLNQKEKETAIKEILERSLKVILPNGKEIAPDTDRNNRCPPRYRCSA